MSFKEKYTKEVVPALKDAFSFENIHRVPKIEKIVVHVGLGNATEDPKLKDVVLENLQKITGQKPVLTLAKKSISNFKSRAGEPIGAKVTLRQQRMYDFLEKLVQITLPRIRDFQGLKPSTVDEYGNMNIGFKEQVAFPEIEEENIEKLHGLQITIKTTAENREEGMKLFQSFGFLFKE